MRHQHSRHHCSQLTGRQTPRTSAGRGFVRLGGRCRHRRCCCDGISRRRSLRCTPRLHAVYDASPCYRAGRRHRAFRSSLLWRKSGNGTPTQYFNDVTVGRHIGRAQHFGCLSRCRQPLSMSVARSPGSIRGQQGAQSGTGCPKVGVPDPVILPHGADRCAGVLQYREGLGHSGLAHAGRIGECPDRGLFGAGQRFCHQAGRGRQMDGCCLGHIWILRRRLETPTGSSVALPIDARLQPAGEADLPDSRRDHREIDHVGGQGLDDKAPTRDAAIFRLGGAPYSGQGRQHRIAQPVTRPACVVTAEALPLRLSHQWAVRPFRPRPA